MQLIEQRMDSALVIRLAGRLDSTNSDDAAQQLLASLERAERHLVLDLSSLEYVSSTGLRTFLLLAKKAKQLNRKTSVCGLTDMVTEIFTISGFTEIFPRFPSVDHAVKAAK
jgi:anti-anti-sigma factor